MSSFNGHGRGRKGGGMKKVLIGGLSLILLVGVILAIVGGISRSKNGSTSLISTTQKAIKAICAPTDYKEACEKTLSGTTTTNPKELIKAAFKATIDEFRSAFHLPENITTADNMQKMALSDCKTLLQYAIDELQASYSEVGNIEIHSMGDRVDNIKNWLSAVLSYQETCMDGLTQPEVKSAMKNVLLNATQLTSNALAMVSEISSILSAFKMSFNISFPSRHLLEKDDDLPTWFTAGDRRLLAGRGGDNVKPNVVVAKDGTGNFKTINDALNAMPGNYRGRYVIYVKGGVYKEQVLVDKNKVNVFMYGDGPRKTIVTGSKNFVDGTPTFQTATFAAIGDGFIAKSMGFSNTAGPEKHQAVALRVQSDMSAFFNCRMDGFQDTLYAQTHRQFYRNCVVSGTIDFIFGDSAVVFQNCLIIARKPMDNQYNTVTAHGRIDKRETTGIVIQNCRIVPDGRLFPVRFKLPSYLGRPWKEYSRTVIMESTVADFIQPEGWKPWDGDFALKTLFYAEYGNRGPGANTNKRVKWPGYKVITNQKEALQYTVGPFIQGGSWLRYTGAPNFLGLKH
ncbi:putative pectinesterase/pectinesterase inhibitor 28 [Tasmannia lanceolata]|uniref:putative pectinesterase/pectinesterase inhibitor 28 n=1 Tax=Tasmannia lanceolata TaxID=3420 RepID=UPI0040645D0F